MKPNALNVWPTNYSQLSCLLYHLQQFKSGAYMSLLENKICCVPHLQTKITKTFPEPVSKGSSEYNISTGAVHCLKMSLFVQ